MPIIDSPTQSRFDQQAQDIFAAECPCIIDRISIAITSGSPIYTLPNYATAIRRITYRGWKLFPMPHRDLRQSYLSGNQGGRPYWYIFNNIGQGQLRLFPVPQENLAQETNWVNLWGSSIENIVVVEFYRESNPADADADRYQIPYFIRTRLIHIYEQQRAYQVDNKGQKRVPAKYWKDKWANYKVLYSTLLGDLKSKSRNIIANNEAMRPYGFIPPPPILPVNKFGVPVDDITG